MSPEWDEVGAEREGGWRGRERERSPARLVRWERGWERYRSPVRGERSSGWSSGGTWRGLERGMHRRKRRASESWDERRSRSRSRRNEVERRWFVFSAAFLATHTPHCRALYRGPCQSLTSRIPPSRMPVSPSTSSTSPSSPLPSFAHPSSQRVGRLPYPNDINVDQLPSLDPASSPSSLSRLSQPLFNPPTPTFSRTVKTNLSVGYLSPSKARRALEQPSPFVEDERLQLLYEGFMRAQCGEEREWFDALVGQVLEFGGNNESFMREVGWRGGGEE